MYKTELDWVSAYKKLEQENEELKKACDETQELLDKQIEATYKLDKENAELKEKYVKNICDCDICDTYCNSQLIKAKEIIKKFSEFVNNKVEYDPEHPQEHTDLWNKLCKQAKQFLNSEVEK